MVSKKIGYGDMGETSLFPFFFFFFVLCDSMSVWIYLSSVARD